MTRRTFHLTTHVEHPGRLIKKNYLKPLGITQRTLAKMMGVPSPELTKLFKGQRDIDEHLAERLGAVLNTTADFWLMLQSIYNEVERHQNEER